MSRAIRARVLVHERGSLDDPWLQRSKLRRSVVVQEVSEAESDLTEGMEGPSSDDGCGDDAEMVAGVVGLFDHSGTYRHGFGLLPPGSTRHVFFDNNTPQAIRTQGYMDVLKGSRIKSVVDVADVNTLWGGLERDMRDYGNVDRKRYCVSAAVGDASSSSACAG